MAGKPLDLKGKVFGQLTAIEPVKGGTDNKRRWLCRCSCGEEELIDTFQLTSGNRVKCKVKQNHFNISIGDVFGKLTVTKFVCERKTRRWKAECVCSCGGDRSVPVRYLQRGSSTHCGCVKKQRKLKQPAQTSLMNILIGIYKGNAKTRGLSCELTKEDFKRLFEGNCYLCVKPPSREFKNKHYEDVFVYSSIDRIDSTKGYELDNVDSCCTECNYLKSNKNIEEFLNHIVSIYVHQKGRGIERK